MGSELEVGGARREVRPEPNLPEMVRMGLLFFCERRRA